jgi:hypothetical protein
VSLELLLLISESVLLAFTVVLLLFSIKEGRGRENLLREVGRATKTFTRLEYFLAVMDAMSDAKKEIAGLITGRFPGPEDRKRTEDIEERIKKAHAAGVQVKYLLPSFHDRLYIGHLYTKAGAEIKYSTCAIPFDLRYMIVDDCVVIVGIPEAVGEKEATKKGYRIPSEGVAGLFREHFLNCWDRAVDFEAYLKQVIRESRASAKQLSIELNIPEKDLERYY